MTSQSARARTTSASIASRCALLGACVGPSVERRTPRRSATRQTPGTTPGVGRRVMFLAERTAAPVARPPRESTRRAGANKDGEQAQALPSRRQRALLPSAIKRNGEVSRTVCSSCLLHAHVAAGSESCTAAHADAARRWLGGASGRDLHRCEPVRSGAAVLREGVEDVVSPGTCAREHDTCPVATSATRRPGSEGQRLVADRARHANRSDPANGDGRLQAAERLAGQPCWRTVMLMTHACPPRAFGTVVFATSPTSSSAGTACGFNTVSATCSFHPHCWPPPVRRADTPPRHQLRVSLPPDGRGDVHAEGSRLGAMDIWRLAAERVGPGCASTRATAAACLRRCRTRGRHASYNALEQGGGRRARATPRVARCAISSQRPQAWRSSPSRFSRWWRTSLSRTTTAIGRRRLRASSEPVAVHASADTQLGR